MVAGDLSLGGFGGQWGQNCAKVMKKFNMLKDEGVRFAQPRLVGTKRKKGSSRKVKIAQESVFDKWPDKIPGENIKSEGSTGEKGKTRDNMTMKNQFSIQRELKTAILEILKSRAPGKTC